MQARSGDGWQRPGIMEWWEEKDDDDDMIGA